MEALLPSDPARVGQYRLLGRLGSGGMGKVYLGRSPGGRHVAVKLIRPDLAENPDFRARFAREVAAARQVAGIFTVHVVDADTGCPQPWLVTDYVAGPSLADLVEEQGPLPAQSVLSLAAGLAEGLAAIHAAGVVHRDLKPSNVLLSSDGPRIIDFGISRAMDAISVTRTGSVVGSPGFMSPEQAVGHAVGPPSDVFSLASVLTFTATGQNPFGSGEATALLYRIVHGEPAIDGVPEALRPIIGRCLAKDPQFRPTASAILAELSPIIQPDYPPATDRDNPSTQAVPAGVPESADATAPYSTADQPAPRRRGSPAVAELPPRRRGARRWALGTAAALVPVAVAAGYLLAARHPAAPPRQVTPAPRAVVVSYINDINRQDWAAAWRLGGDNISRALGESYAQFKAGFSQTAHVKIQSLSAAGDVVQVMTRATEKTGPVQTYALTYVVQRGVIVSGVQRLLSTTG